MTATSLQMIALMFNNSNGSVVFTLHWYVESVGKVLVLVPEVSRRFVELCRYKFTHMQPSPWLGNMRQILTCLQGGIFTVVHII